MSDSERYSDKPLAYFDPSVLVGQWADSTNVHRARDEFTIDFVRHVPEPAERALIARALVSPVLAADLRDQLDEAWRAYLAASMPEDRR